MAKVKTIYRNGKKLSNNQVRETIMKANNIKTIKDYEKFYDITRNKLRNYEKFSGKEKSSVREFLYKEARSKLFYGEEYKPTIERKRIDEFTSLSTGKAFSKQLGNTDWYEKQLIKYNDETYDKFEGFLRKNAKAREIWLNVTDTFKREEALKDFANKMHAEIDARGKSTGKQAIPEKADIVGSSDYEDFDYSSYMSE